MFRHILATAALIPLLLGCALTGASAEPPLSPDLRAISADQRGLVTEVCDRVMGLGRGGVYRSECMDSLARSFAAKTQGIQTASNFSACRSRGLSEGTAAFSTCMLDSRGTYAAQPQPAQKIAYDWTTPENAKSYFDVSNSVRWRREQYSCAQIGLTPGTGGFGQCVASLEAALMPNPF
jgi:hypothetical protein